MPFPLKIRLDALIACQRQCCLCHQRKHTRIQCHHIIQEADNGPNSFDNCIPICPDCHAEVMAFNIKHPFGATPYHPSELKRRRDDWYAVVQRKSQELVVNLQRSPSSYPHSKSLQGKASFNYSNHDGFYRLGEGNFEFLTHWSKGSDTTIYCYRDSTNVEVALAPKNIQLQDIRDASLLNFSSRVRSPQIGEFIILENHAGRYAAIKILKIQDDTRGHPEDILVFDYWILENGSDNFSDTA
ncbi:MAG: HNH endonuclease [Dolichospermum sp. JUN01]|nr:HNH endonuclease [Dolichospermum sp. JUN01]